MARRDAAGEGDRDAGREAAGEGGRDAAAEGGREAAGEGDRGPLEGLVNFALRTQLITWSY